MNDSLNMFLALAFILFLVYKWNTPNTNSRSYKFGRGCGKGIKKVIDS